VARRPAPRHDGGMITTLPLLLALGAAPAFSPCSTDLELCLAQAQAVAEKDPRQAYDRLLPLCTPEAPRACEALEALVARQRVAPGFFVAPAAGPQVAKLFEAGTDVLAGEVAALVCRVRSKESCFRLNWSVGPFAAGEVRGAVGTAFFLAGGAGLRKGDRVRVGASRDQSGYSIRNVFLDLPVLPGFGDTFRYPVHRFEVVFESLPLRASDERGDLECRAVPDTTLAREVRGARAALASALKRLPAKPTVRVAAEELGYDDTNASSLALSAAMLADWVGWGDPEVRAAIRTFQDFDARWAAEVKKALPALTKRAVVNGLLDGLPVTVSVARLSCDPGDGAAYWPKMDRPGCMLEVEATRPDRPVRPGADDDRVALTPQELLVSEFSVLGEDGRRWPVSAEGLIGPDGAYSTTWTEKAGPGQKLTVVLRVLGDGRPALLSHKNRWFRLPAAKPVGR